ncbi:VOC family protein [Nocardia australiensis]|uniref:VOC family protein n=1 Tax=Nocardia australiensis TaxID=2887191 RepID=UPI0027E1A483|nr:VOC family protein [Nocardia australiensis]
MLRRRRTPHAPAWPDNPQQPKRVHFDLAVEDLATATERALELGATLPSFQPGADPEWAGQPVWTVVLDPEGTPICLNTSA